jgi:hypothetical protein
VPAFPFISRLTHPIGLRLKQLLLLFGGLYLGMVAVTNLVNVVTSAADVHLTFLNSQNADYITATVMRSYGWSHAAAVVAVLGAAILEGAGAWLFARALRRFRGGGSGLTEAYQALTWNLVVWFAFIVGTEFFLAYPAESSFRELMGLGLLMVLVVAVVPDELGSDTSD